MFAETIQVQAPDAVLTGDLVVPDGAQGMVVFAHGSGSSRHSPRNGAVAAELNRAGFGTLLLDLLTEDEERNDLRTGAYRFDIELLTRRLCAATDWTVGRYPELPIGLFGASSGAAAALDTAAARPEQVRTVVSRGGRPDLASEVLDQVSVPVLLLVGERDETVLGLNRTAAERLNGPVQVQVVPNATHLFEEPGALQEVAEAAAEWFTRMSGKSVVRR